MIEHLFGDAPGSKVIDMSTTGATHTSGAAGPRHLRLVTDHPARRGRPPRIGTPQRLASSLAGLATGFALGAIATVLGGGDGRTLATIALACLGLTVPALVACRRRVLAQTRVRPPASVPVARARTPRPAATPLRVVHAATPAASPLRRAA